LFQFEKILNFVGDYVESKQRHYKEIKSCMTQLDAQAETRQKQKQIILEILSKLKMQNEMIKNLTDKGKESAEEVDKCMALLEHKTIENEQLTRNQEELILCLELKQSAENNSKPKAKNVKKLQASLKEKEEMQVTIQKLNQLTTNQGEELTRMSSAIDNKNKTIFKLVSDNESLCTKVTSIESKLDVFRDRASEIKRDFDRLGDINRELNCENQLKNEKITELELSMNQMREKSFRLDKAKSVIAQLKQREEKYCKKVNKLKKYLKNRDDTIAKLENESTEIGSSLNLKDDNIAELQADRLKKEFSAEKKYLEVIMSAAPANAFKEYISNLNIVESQVIVAVLN
jgi:hypothetical protein